MKSLSLLTFMVMLPAISLWAQSNMSTTATAASATEDRIKSPNVNEFIPPSVDPNNKIAAVTMEDQEQARPKPTAAKPAIVKPMKRRKQNASPAPKRTDYSF